MPRDLVSGTVQKPRLKNSVFPTPLRVRRTVAKIVILETRDFDSQGIIGRTSQNERR